MQRDPDILPSQESIFTIAVARVNGAQVKISRSISGIGENGQPFTGVWIPEMPENFYAFVFTYARQGN